MLVDFKEHEWLPDRGPVSTPGLVLLQNLLPVADGYAAMPDFKDAGMSDDIDSAVRGADRGRTQSGADYIVAGTDSKLFLAVDSSVFVDESIVGGYTLGTTDRWEFALYGNRILCTHGIGVDPPNEFNIGTSTTFTALSADAPFAKQIETVREFIVMGDIEGRGVNAAAIGRQEGGLQWCAIGDPTSWPQVGTAAAANAQSDFQVLEGDGGAVCDIVAAAEYTAVLRERQIWRMDYVGRPAIFNFRKIDDRRGCLQPGTGVAVGNTVYFPSDEGFLAFNGGSVIPIGHEKVDRTWRSMVDRTQDFRVSAAHWPRQRLILWTVPGAAGTSTIFAYHYALDRWTLISKGSIEWILSVLSTGGTSLDDAPYATMDMDTASPAGLGDVNLDTLTVISDEDLGAFLSDHKLYTATSETSLSGALEIGDFEDPEGTMLRMKIRGIRPIFNGDGSSLSGYVRTRMNPSDGSIITGAQPLRSTGILPVRATGRYVSVGLLTSGKIGHLQGFDPLFKMGGRR